MTAEEKLKELCGGRILTTLELVMANLWLCREIDKFLKDSKHKPNS